MHSGENASRSGCAFNFLIWRLSMPAAGIDMMFGRAHRRTIQIYQATDDGIQAATEKGQLLVTNEVDTRHPVESNQKKNR